MRKRVLTDLQIKKVIAEQNEGSSLASIAKKLGVNSSTLRTAVIRYKKTNTTSEKSIQETSKKTLRDVMKNHPSAEVKIHEKHPELVLSRYMNKPAVSRVIPTVKETTGSMASVSLLDKIVASVKKFLGV